MTGKAYYLVSHGNASSSFELRSFQVASPMDHEVLIKVEAFGLNFADVMARRGKYRDAPSLPFVPGYDVVGRIYKVGNHVNQDLLGKRVAAFCRFGGYSNWIVTPTNAIVVIDDLPAGIALALCTQGVTAQYMAAHCTHLTEDDYVLIHAAAGGVGSLLIQLLKNQKVKVIAKVGSDEKAKVVRELGADFVINYRENDYLSSAKNISKKQMISAIFNAQGGKSVPLDLKLLSPGGLLFLFGGAGLLKAKWGLLSTLGFLKNTGLFSPIPLMMQSKGLIGINMLKIADHSPQKIQNCMQACFEKHRKGILKPLSGLQFSHEQLAIAHQVFEDGNTSGKISIYWEDLP